MGIESEQYPLINVMDAVRDMIWNDADVRQTYEALRMRGVSADEAVNEIARGYIGCLWEASQKMPYRWPEVLREIGERRFSFSDSLS